MKERVSFITVRATDCEWQTFAAGGKGGQNQNTCNTGVRCIHKASGARGEARDSRRQVDNRRAAFQRMAITQEFNRWINS